MTRITVPAPGGKVQLGKREGTVTEKEQKTEGKKKEEEKQFSLCVYQLYMENPCD